MVKDRLYISLIVVLGFLLVIGGLSGSRLIEESVGAKLAPDGLCETCDVQMFDLYLNITVIFGIILIFCGVMLILFKIPPKRVIEIFDLKEKRNITLLLVLIFSLYFLSGYFSDQPFQHDSIAHYLISRYSWKHPTLFLNQWNRPIFTLFSSPFAQFGLFSFQLFNILIATLTIYISYLIATKLNIKRPYLTIFFCAFAPLYFLLSFSGLTEPLFALILMLSFYTIITDKFTISSLLVSSLPLIRPEGLLIIIVWLYFYFTQKKFKQIPLLFVFPMIVNISGFLVYGELFFIVTSNPYINNTAYGTGTLSHYFKEFIFVVGPISLLLFQIGFLRLLKRTNKLLHYSFLTYFLFHVLIWRIGGVASNGFSRVFVGILPLTAIFANEGLNYTLEESDKKFDKSLIALFLIESIWLLLISRGGIRTLFNVMFFFYVLIFIFTKTIHVQNKRELGNKIIIVTIVLTMLTSVIYVHPPQKSDIEHRTISEAMGWFDNSIYRDRTIYTYHPTVLFLLEKDPWTEQIRELSDARTDVPKGSVIIWESHYGPRRINLEYLHEDNYILLKSFEPDPKEKSSFIMYFFLKRNNKKTSDQFNQIVRKSSLQF